MLASCQPPSSIGPRRYLAERSLAPELQIGTVERTLVLIELCKTLRQPKQILTGTGELGNRLQAIASPREMEVPAHLFFN